MVTTQPNATSWRELLSLVEDHDGVLKVPMEILRTVKGAQRLGHNVLTQMESHLASLGLGHIPQSLPNRGDKNIVLYRFGTPASECIKAIREDIASDEVYKDLARLNRRSSTGPTGEMQSLKERQSELIDLMSQLNRMVTNLPTSEPTSPTSDDAENRVPADH